MLRGGVSGINHITLDVINLPRSIRFYCEILGCELRAQWDSGAYMECGATWICLQVVPTMKSAEGTSHIAFDVASEDFQTLSEKLMVETTEWKANTSEGESLYFLDPDRNRLEIHVGSLQSRLNEYRQNCA
ncbi:MAG TPA: VOC family protein, partial [Fimbriimonas sp.]|nr:VOC family protein [Fimbriimonas sp.]